MRLDDLIQQLQYLQEEAEAIAVNDAGEYGDKEAWE